MIGVALGNLGAGNCTLSTATMVSIKEISEREFEWPYYMGRISLKLNTTIGCFYIQLKRVLKFLVHERKRKTIGWYLLGMLASINTDNLTPNHCVPQWVLPLLRSFLKTESSTRATCWFFSCFLSFLDLSFLGSVYKFKRRCFTVFLLLFSAVFLSFFSAHKRKREKKEGVVFSLFR